MTPHALTRHSLWLSIFTLALCCCFQSLSAQKRTQKTSTKSNASKTTAVSTDKRAEAQKLMNAYRFDEAVTLLEAEVKKETRAKHSTTLLEEELRRARLGAQMLTATERVCFIDSTVVARKDFFQAYRLSKECGRIGPLARLASSMATAENGQTTGVTAYVNSLEDRLYFAAPDSTGLLKLNLCTKTGNRWSEPQQLQGMGSDDDVQDYPYMMADGVTLYYAAQSNDGLGGYDIYVTRASDDTHFVKAENVGMPFNSPANDYMMAIDEENNLGWFVTDRNQAADSVCIYCFVPSETREVYDLDATGEEALQRYARIASLTESCEANIKDNPALAASIDEAKERLQTLKADPQSATGSSAQSEAMRFVISDSRVYTSLSQFRNATARSIAQEVTELKRTISQKETTLSQLRNVFQSSQRATSGAKSQLRDDILKAEKELEQLYSRYAEKEKTMRRIELAQ